MISTLLGAQIMSGENDQEARNDGLLRREVLQAAGGLAVAAGVSGDATPAAAAETPRTAPVTLHINGKKHELHIETRVTLLDALREYLGLTGTKKGCDH